MNNKKSIEQFHAMPVHKAVIKNALPAMATMIMVLIYNLADTFFIGQTGDALQVAAVSLATPVFLLFTGLGTIFGIGGTSVISRAMGEGRPEYARKISAFCMWSCVVLGITVSLLFWIFMDPMLSLVGASPETWDYARSYLSIVILCGPFVLIGNCFSNILRAEGQVTKAMMGMLMGNLLNIVLDPIMILGFGWNIAGAAIATVIGNILGAVYYILYFLRGKSTLSIHIKDFSVTNRIASSVVAIGVPAALGSILMSVSQIIANSEIARYGDMAVAGMGVSSKISMIIGVVCVGLGQGVQPLLGYCVGARAWPRYRSILKFSLCFALAVGAVLTGVCYLLLDPLVRAFLTDVSAFEYGVRFSRILLCTNVLFGVYYVLINSLQAMGAAGASLIINLSRQGLIYIPSLFLLNFLLGINGILWAQPVADILSFLLVVVLNLSVSKRMMKKDREQTVADRSLAASAE